MNNPIIMHITYCEQGQSIIEACRNAVRWGYDGIELRSRRLDDSQSIEEYLDTAISAIDQSGLKHVLFGYPTADLMLPDAECRKREVEQAIDFFRIAKTRLGERFSMANAFTGNLRNPDKNVPANAYELHGSGCATEAQWDAAVTGFRQIGEVAAEINVRLAFETHMHYLHDTPVAAKELVKRINNLSVGVNLDYANCFCFKKFAPVGEVIEQLGEHLFYVHLKNIIKQSASDNLRVGLADGEINNREFLRLLKKSNYSGFIGLEAPRQGDREWFAQQDLAYFRSIMQDL
jgi:sugar phosphate isomerase/epimerase